MFHSYLIEKGYSINSARNMTLGIRQLFRYYQMPVTMRSGSKVSQTVKTTKNFPLTIEHVRKMFQVANLKERTILSLAVDTGLRISDFLTIQKTDLPPLDGEPPLAFTLLNQKEKIPAHCFLSQESIDLLRTYLPTLKKKDNLYLFSSNGRSHISDEAISKMLNAALTSQLQAGFHGVGLLKTADPFVYIGDQVTYQIKVYNPSEFDLLNINVTDPMLGFEETIPFLAAGNTTGVTFTLQREVLNTDPNPLMNTVSVEAVDTEGVYSTASTQAFTTVAEKLLSITKVGPEFAHVGDAVTYTLVVENVGDSDVANVTVNDEMLGFSWMGDLAVAESNVFNITYVVPKGASDPLINVVTAYAEVNQTTIYAEGEWSVDILHPKLTVNKMVEPEEVSAEQNVTFSIEVNNTGDADLYNLTLVDTIYGEAPAEVIPSMLSPGDSFTWSFNATVSDQCFVNKAKATGVDALGKKVCDSDKVNVYVQPKTCPEARVTGRTILKLGLLKRLK
jgi:uncharacterized repeat protein (TIGR01451 family)